MMDPLRQAAERVAEISGQVAQLLQARAEINAQIETALDVATANGFDRNMIRVAAEAMRLQTDGRPDERAGLRGLYVAAVQSTRGR